MKLAIKKIWKRMEGINGLILILYSIFIFSTDVITNDKLGELYFFNIPYFVVSEILIIILSIVICPAIIRLLSKISIRGVASSCKPACSKIYNIAFYVIPFFLFLFYYISHYPGGFSPDSITQFAQTIDNKYNDWHPVIHTLIAFKLPLSLTGGWIGSIVLFQIICFSAVLGYSFNAIYKYTNLKFAVLSMLFVILNPQSGYIAMYPWKDTSFAIGALLLLTFSLHIYMSNGTWIKSKRNLLLFILTGTLTTLFRHNAILFTFPLIIAVFFYMTRKRGLIVCMSILVLCMGIRLPLYSAMNVEQPDQRQVETLGLPMTVIGAAVTYTPLALDEETLEFAYKVAPKEVWEEKYSYGSYNNVKWDDRTDNEIIEEYGATKVISMMIRCFQSSPRVSLKALIKLTRAIYTVSDGYSFFDVPGITHNNYGIEPNVNYDLCLYLKTYTDIVAANFPHIFMYLGVMHLLLIASVLSKYKLSKLSDWKKIFFIIPVFAYNYGTALLLTSSSDSSRFFYYVFPLMPILLVFLFHKNNERGTDTNVLVSE